MTTSLRAGPRVARADRSEPRRGVGDAARRHVRDAAPRRAAAHPAGGRSPRSVYSFISAMTSISAVIFLTSPRFDMATVNIVGRAEVGEYGYAIGVCVGADRADDCRGAADPRARRTPANRASASACGIRRRRGSFDEDRVTAPASRNRYRCADFRRRHRGLGDQQRAPAVVEPDRRRAPLRRARDEVVELARVRLGVALDEEVAAADPARMPSRVVALERRRLVVARDQHALVAERLDPLVVAVHGAKARIDVHERAARHRQHHHGRVWIAMRIRRSRRACTRCARRSRPARRRSASAPCRSRGSSCRRRCRTASPRRSRAARSPGRGSTAPASRAADLAGANRVEQRAMRRIEAPVEADEERRARRSPARRAHASTRLMSRSTGFSQNTALPARAARSMIAACVRGGVQIITAPTSRIGERLVEIRRRPRAVLRRERSGRRACRGRRPSAAARSDARRCSRRAAVR